MNIHIQNKKLIPMEFIIIDMQDKDHLEVLSGALDGKTKYFPTRERASKSKNSAKEPVIINLVEQKANPRQDQLQLIRDEIVKTEESWDTLTSEQKTPEKTSLYTGIKIGLVTALEIISGEKL